MRHQDETHPQLTRTPLPDRSADPASSGPRRATRRGTRATRRSPGRIRALLSSAPARLTLATGLACCLGVVVVAESRTVSPADPVGAALADRAAAAGDQPASRSSRR
ncbi:MAG TPA: hypothetical protein VGD43_20795, partial [Micromonospora sp.]